MKKIWENNCWSIRNKRRREDKKFYRKSVKVTLHSKNLTNNYIVNSKIEIMKCGHKRENWLYI